ncbi:MAG: pyrimidine reductase [Actinotalea sp.]|nr:pyrimidine reductase [Actinotalea sp.]
MATIVSTLFIALDGVVEIDPAWHSPYFDDQMGTAVGEDYEDVDLLLLGRVTYDSFAGAWPERETAGGEDATFATQLGDTRKVVATRGQQDLGWRNVERLQGDLVEAVRRLADEPDIHKILVAGSISVVRQLLATGLLDELHLLVHPVAARKGERLFDEGEPIYPLRLLRSDVFSTGVVRLVYAPAGLPAAQTEDEVVDTVNGAGAS